MSLGYPTPKPDQGWLSHRAYWQVSCPPEEVFRFETYLKGSKRNAVDMAEKSKEFIVEKSDQPFFLYFAPSDPHRGGGTDMNSKNKLKPDLFGNKPNRQSHTGVKEVF